VGLGTRELRRLNGVRDAAELRGGTTVVLPASAAAMRVAAAEPTDARAVAATTEGAGELPVPGAAGALDPVGPLLAAVPDRTFALADRERAFYRTCEGDTLAELAAVFGVGEQDIVGWNNLDPAARLQARMVLQLYLPAGAGRADVALLAPAELRVVTLGSEEFHTLDAARRGKRRVAVTARAGDTLVKIARRFGLQPGDLARVNRLAWWAELPEGRPLVVYTSAAPPRELAVGRTLSPKRPAGREAHPAASTINRGLTLPPAKTAVPARPIKRGGKPAPVPAPARTMRR